MFCWQDLLQSWVVAGTKLTSTNISIGKLKRELTVAERDMARDAIYFGTTSGDVIKVRRSNCHNLRTLVKFEEP